MKRRRDARGGLALALVLAGAPAAARDAPEPDGAAPSATVETQLGSLDPFRPPAPAALELNAAGKIPYRQGKWDEARAQYRAAEAADPEFLAPKLNVACSFVRQERFAEATAEVVSLLDRAYVPWGREVLDAADLGALKPRPEMKELQRAMAGAAAKWGAAVAEGLLFVARQRPPLRVPDGPGVFLLNPHQEVWAYLPRTQRYLQVTAEDGHVVAMAPSSDGRRLLYVTAEKLVRGARPGDLALRGVAVRELTFATMTLGPPARVDGDVRRLAIYPPSLVIALGERQARNETVVALSPEGGLVPARGRPPRGEPLVTLTGRGVAPAREGHFGGRFVGRFVARAVVRPATGAPSLDAGPIGGRLTPLKTGEGAGLTGLLLP